MPLSTYPVWLKKRVSASSSADSLFDTIKKFELKTICQQGHCPNILECFGKKHVTFLISGNKCTRKCRFCAMEKDSTGIDDTLEAEKIAETVKMLDLKYVILTSVTRDDLPDRGVGRFVECIQKIRSVSGAIKIEVLIPDFDGNEGIIKRLLDIRPDIFSHNIETVPRLYKRIRPDFSYARSLGVLKSAKKFDSQIITKSGIMVGMGETEKEVLFAIKDLRDSKCDILTIGQYLPPSKGHHAIREYVRPKTFKAYDDYARSIGLRYVNSGPFVRSSYNAADVLMK